MKSNNRSAIWKRRMFKQNLFHLKKKFWKNVIHAFLTSPVSILTGNWTIEIKPKQLWLSFSKVSMCTLFFSNPTSPPWSLIGSVPCVSAYTLSSPAFREVTCGMIIPLTCAGRQNRIFNFLASSLMNSKMETISKKVCMFGCRRSFCRPIFASKTAIFGIFA